MKRIGLFVIMALTYQLGIAQQSGDLDPSFGTAGIVQTAFADESFEVDVIRNVVVQPDGKIIAVGSSRINGKKRTAHVRYMPDGMIDASFGDNGKLLIPISATLDNFTMDVVTLSDNTIMFCGYIFNPDNAIATLFLIKTDANGHVNTAFGTDGVMVADFEGKLLPEKMHVQPDDKIVITGYYKDNIMALRYNPDGSIDSSFGQDGMTVLEIDGSVNHSFAKNLDIQPDGKILLAGFFVENKAKKWIVVRLNADGSLDNSFGINGLKKITIGEGHDVLLAVRVQSDGKILLAGHSWVENQPVLLYDAVVMRLNADGSPDDSFADSGIFRKRFVNNAANCVSGGMVLSPDGKIYVDLSTKNNEEENIGVFSLDQNGALNTAFAQNGYVITDLGADDHTEAIAMQQDGKILVGATSFSDTGSPFIVVRYLSDVVTDLISPINNGEMFALYPNPTKDVLHIDYDGLATVQIFDMSGRMLIEMENTPIIDVAPLAAGNYIIKLTAEDGVFTEQFVKN